MSPRRKKVCRCWHMCSGWCEFAAQPLASSRSSLNTRVCVASVPAGTCRSSVKSFVTSTGAAQSTSTTASCQLLRAQSPTTERTNAGSRSSAPQHTMPPANWTQDPLLSRCAARLTALLVLAHAAGSRMAAAQLCWCSHTQPPAAWQLHSCAGARTRSRQPHSYAAIGCGRQSTPITARA